MDDTKSGRKYIIDEITTDAISKQDEYQISSMKEGLEQYLKLKFKIENNDALKDELLKTIDELETKYQNNLYELQSKDHDFQIINTEIETTEKKRNNLYNLPSNSSIKKQIENYNLLIKNLNKKKKERTEELKNLISDTELNDYKNKLVQLDILPEEFVQYDKLKVFFQGIFEFNEEELKKCKDNIFPCFMKYYQEAKAFIEKEESKYDAIISNYMKLVDKATYNHNDPNFIKYLLYIKSKIIRANKNIGSITSVLIPTNTNPVEHSDTPNKQTNGTRPEGMRQDGKIQDGTRPEGMRQDGTRPEGMRQDGTRPEGMRQDGTRPEGMRQDGKIQDGTRPEGMRQDGKIQDGTRPEGMRQDEKIQDGMLPKPSRVSFGDNQYIDPPYNDNDNNDIDTDISNDTNINKIQDAAIYEINKMKKNAEVEKIAEETVSNDEMKREVEKIAESEIDNMKENDQKNSIINEISNIIAENEEFDEIKKLVEQTATQTIEQELEQNAETLPTVQELEQEQAEIEQQKQEELEEQEEILNNFESIIEEQKKQQQVEDVAKQTIYNNIMKNQQGGDENIKPKQKIDTNNSKLEMEKKDNETVLNEILDFKYQYQDKSDNFTKTLNSIKESNETIFEPIDFQFIDKSKIEDISKNINGNKNDIVDDIAIKEFIENLKSNIDKVREKYKLIRDSASIFDDLKKSKKGFEDINKEFYQKLRKKEYAFLTKLSNSDAQKLGENSFKISSTLNNIDNNIEYIKKGNEKYKKSLENREVQLKPYISRYDNYNYYVKQGRTSSANEILKSLAKDIIRNEEKLQTNIDVDDNNKRIDDLKENIKQLKDGIKGIDDIFESHINDINRKLKPSIYRVVNDDSTKSKYENVWEQYLQNINNGDMIIEEAKDKFFRNVVSNNLDPSKVLKLTRDDVIIYIVICFVIRQVCLAIVETLIDKSIISNVFYSLIAYLVIYTIILISMIIVINVDDYKLRIVLNFFNLHINKPGIFTHVTMVIGFTFIIYTLVYFMNPDIHKLEYKQLSEVEKLNLIYKLELISIAVFTFISITDLLLSS